MATQAERLAVVEIKVANIESKVGEIKEDVKDLHDCLDRTRDLLDKKLDDMLEEYRENRNRYYARLDEIEADSKAAHAVLEDKLSNFDRIKTRVTIGMVAVVAFIAGAGYLTVDHLKTALKILA